MKFLLDVCVSSRSLHTILADLGHDVLLALDVDPSAPDEALPALALRERRVLVTEDKDFGELVFVHRLPHPSIVRFVEMPVEDQVAAMQELLDRYPAEMQKGALIVVTRDRIRVRHKKRERRRGGQVFGRILGRTDGSSCITVYRPDPDRWINWQERKKKP